MEKADRAQMNRKLAKTISIISSCLLLLTALAFPPLAAFAVIPVLSAVCMDSSQSELTMTKLGT